MTEKSRGSVDTDAMQQGMEGTFEESYGGGQGMEANGYEEKLLDQGLENISMGDVDLSNPNANKSLVENQPRSFGSELKSSDSQKKSSKDVKNQKLLHDT